MRSLHVAVSQIHAKAGDVRGNLDRIARQARAAAIVGVDVILFAETCIHAYDLSSSTLALAEPLDGPIAKELQTFANEYKIALMAGFFQRDGTSIYNSHLVVRPDGRPDAQQKHNLTKHELDARLTAGPRRRTVFTFNGVRSALLICADTGMDGLESELEQQRVEYCFIPTGGGGQLSQMLHESELSSETARARYVKDRECVFEPAAILEQRNRFTCGFASANALGFDGAVRCHRGHCMIVDNNQIMRAQIPGTNILEHQQDQMAHATLSFPD